MSKLKPFINVGPGDSIREELSYLGWEQKDLAEVMGCTEKHISQLVTNKAPITYETACQLSKIFKQSVQFWLNLDANYRQRLQESAKVADTAAKALIYSYMPVRELRHYVDLPRKTEQLVAAVKRFWDRDVQDFDFLESEAQVCFRKSEAYNNFNPYFALTWLQLARNVTESKLPKAAYVPERLEALAAEMPDYTIKPDGVVAFVKELERCGVVFMQIDHFEKTYVDGASFFHGERPVIIYTARQNRNDNFWFTIAHEIGHILLHADSQGSVFIDTLDDLDLSDQRECEADDFAGSILKSDQIKGAFRDVKRPSVVRVKIRASELGLHPAVVAGSLQHQGTAAWTSFHELKEPVKHLLPSLPYRRAT